MYGGERFQGRILAPRDEVLTTLNQLSDLRKLDILTAALEEPAVRYAELLAQVNKGRGKPLPSTSFRDQCSELVKVGLLGTRRVEVYGGVVRTPTGTQAVDAFKEYNEMLVGPYVRSRIDDIKRLGGERNGDGVVEMVSDGILEIAKLQSGRSELYALLSLPLPDEDPATFKGLLGYYLGLSGITKQPAAFHDLMTKLVLTRLAVVTPQKKIGLSELGKTSLEALEDYHNRLAVVAQAVSLD